MKNTRCFKWIVWLLAIMMGLSLTVAIAEDDTKTSEGYRIGMMEFKELDDSFVKVATTLNSAGKEVDLSTADPNASYTLHLEIQEPESGSGLPEDTTQVDLYYTLTDMIAENGSNDDVSWVYEDGDVVFKWKNGKVESFSADISVTPHYAEVQELNGKDFVIAAYNNVLLSEEKSAGALKAVAITGKDSEGKILYESPENPFWTFNHVSGDWYTISRNGKYLNIGAGLTISDNKQFIRVEQREGYYLLHVNGRSLSCVKATDGAITAGVGNKIELKQQVALYSEVSNLSTNGIGEKGSYVITNSKPQYKNLLLDVESEKNVIRAARFDLDGNTLLPKGEYVVWQFEQIARDWYTISNGNGKYLTITAQGPAISTEAKPVLVKRNGNNNQYSFSGVEKNNIYLNNKADSTVMGFRYTDKNEYKWLQLYSDVRATETVIPSGAWLITNPSNHALLMTDSLSEGVIKSIAYEDVDTTEGLVYFETDAELPLWTFEKVSGNMYYVKSGDKYLTLNADSAKLADEPQLLTIQQNGNKYRITNGTIYELRSKTNSAKDGFYAYYDHYNKSAEAWLTLSKTSGGHLVFDINGGNVAEVPGVGTVEAGDVITLPNYQGTKDGAQFVGWSEVKNFYVTANGEKTCCRKLFKAGDEYTIPYGKKTLYAVYDTTSHNVRFGIRLDGQIQDEPNMYNASSYGGHFWMNDVRISDEWVIDISAAKQVNGYYMENNVTSALSNVPSAEQIAAALKKEGNVIFDPETQYVHWYVLKYTTKEWHIDGVVREKAMVSVTYDTNVDDANEKINIQMPAAYQMPVGTSIVIGASKDQETIITPSRTGYVFKGWNTSKDGNGTSYNEGSYLKVTENIHLYAQWEDASEGNMIIKIISDWPEGKPAYKGTMITLTAVLTGYENKEYTLQWEYSTDRENWTDMPDATGVTMTYEMNETTAQYYWRVKAVNVRNKE